MVCELVDTRKRTQRTLAKLPAPTGAVNVSEFLDLVFVTVTSANLASIALISRGVKLGLVLPESRIVDALLVSSKCRESGSSGREGKLSEICTRTKE